MERISTLFSTHSTADDVAGGLDLSDRSMVVTGGAGGLGLETARALARAGASVTLAVRNLAAGERAAAEISESTGNLRVIAAALDLANLDSIDAFARAWRGPLHVLVANAGVMAPPFELTRYGWELQFAVNHLGHFALALGLRDALAAAGSARIVSVSSSAHQRSPVEFDDLHCSFRPYDPIGAYAQSKTANILFAIGATRHWGSIGVAANALMPGAIETPLQRHIGGIRTPPERRKTREQGAATSVLLAASPALEGIGGRYFVDCNEAEVVERRTDDFSGVAPYAVDAGNADRLWEISHRLLEAEWVRR